MGQVLFSLIISSSPSLNIKMVDLNTSILNKIDSKICFESVVNKQPSDYYGEKNIITVATSASWREAPSNYGTLISFYSGGNYMPQIFFDAVTGVMFTRMYVDGQLKEWHRIG